MIREIQNTFLLETEHTTYCFRVLKMGQLEHLYYGRRIRIDEDCWDALTEKHVFAPGNTNVYDKEHPGVSLEDIRLEMSAYGKGDIREPFVEVIHADGSYTSDFVYEKAEITKGKEAFILLPGSYDESGEVEHLCVTLRDKNYDLRLELHYYVYADCDVITRSARLINEGSEAVRVKRLMSTQVDFDTPDYVFTTFNGA